MHTLRLTQRGAGAGSYHIGLDLRDEHGANQTAEVEFVFEFAEQEQEDIRWYLEEHLDRLVYDPLPEKAVRVEKRMAESGAELFRAILQANDDARDLWAVLRQKIADTRIEISTDVREAAAIPWELLRDPKTDVPLALRAASFVRTYTNPAQTPKVPKQLSLPVRILLVICRPGGRDDVPFRSVAMKILKGLNDEAREAFQLDVLRPSTFDGLSAALRKARDAGTPYHVVHFDGHGSFTDLAEMQKMEELQEEVLHFDPNHYFAVRQIYPDTPKPGKRGYLSFENPEVKQNLQLVDGPKLGNLLVETGVPVLVLNACRSAHTETQSEKNDESPQVTATPDNPHTQVRAFGSLAQEVMDCGVAGVVAMRYNVYVVTTAQFVADLYGALARGCSLGEAVSRGRKQLKDQPLREVGFKQVPLQDWTVPVVYEAQAVPLFPKAEGADRMSAIQIKLGAGESKPQRGMLDPELPQEPDVGFFGRDEVLLNLERAFDRQHVVLLHAYAGSGKTTAAAEFARWYTLTGGVEVVLFTTFERYITLPQVLAKLERVFGPMLEQNDIHWLALKGEEQRNVALQIFQQIPLLWIWDNVEPVVGFPSGTESDWSAAEQRELVDFLRQCRNSRARFLLTSRRDEQGWLENLPRRIPVPPMPMQERVLLARGIAEKHGVRLTEVVEWWPLLRFTQGNPLTITVLVGQVLRDSRSTRKQIEEFVQQLRTGKLPLTMKPAKVAQNPWAHRCTTALPMPLVRRNRNSWLCCTFSRALLMLMR